MTAHKHAKQTHNSDAKCDLLFRSNDMTPQHPYKASSSLWVALNESTYYEFEAKSITKPQVGCVWKLCRDAAVWNWPNFTVKTLTVSLNCGGYLIIIYLTINLIKFCVTFVSPKQYFQCFVWLPTCHSSSLSSCQCWVDTTRRLRC